MTDSEFSPFLREHTTYYYRLISRQAVLAARTLHSTVSGYTWYWVSRGQPTIQNEVNHDKFATYRERAVGDSVLARDLLWGQPWQASTVVQQTWPSSFQVQLNDGHSNDVLQNTPSSAVTQSSSVKVTSDQSTEGVTSPSTESSAPPPEGSESMESPSLLTPPTPALRWPKHAIKPPQRLVEQMD